MCHVILETANDVRTCLTTVNLKIFLQDANLDTNIYKKKERKKKELKNKTKTKSIKTKQKKT